MLQGEALMNDASGLVTFKFALAAAITGVFSLTDASFSFVLVALGGLAVGVALSWLIGRLRAWMIARGWDDPATHVVFMLLLPFAAYVLAERLGVSGHPFGGGRRHDAELARPAATADQHAPAQPQCVVAAGVRFQRPDLPAAGPAVAGHHQGRGQP
jgi:NhaP-type Na+/H+ and K+/H+ antiporters